MNRRQFIAGLAASTAPMVGCAPLWPVLSDTCVPLPYKDPSLTLINLHENLNAAFRITKEQFAANVMNGLTEVSLKGTLHELS